MASITLTSWCALLHLLGAPRGEERESRLEKAKALRDDSPIAVGTRELLSPVSRNSTKLLDRLDEFSLRIVPGVDPEVVYARTGRLVLPWEVVSHVLARAAVHVYAGTKADGRGKGVNIDRVLALLSDAGFAAGGPKVVGNVSRSVAESVLQKAVYGDDCQLTGECTTSWTSISLDALSSHDRLLETPEGRKHLLTANGMMHGRGWTQLFSDERTLTTLFSRKGEPASAVISSDAASGIISSGIFIAVGSGADAPGREYSSGTGRVAVRTRDGCVTIAYGCIYGGTASSAAPSSASAAAAAASSPAAVSAAAAAAAHSPSAASVSDVAHQQHAADAAQAEHIAEAAREARDGRLHRGQPLGCGGHLKVEMPACKGGLALITVTPCDKHGLDSKEVSITRDNNCLMLHAATMVEVLTEFSAQVKSSDTEKEFVAKLTIHNSTCLDVEAKNSAQILRHCSPTHQYVSMKGTGTSSYESLRLAAGDQGRKTCLHVQARLQKAKDLGGEEVVGANARHCLCQVRISSDDQSRAMIQCCNDGCPIGWFHMECVGVDEEEVGDDDDDDDGFVFTCPSCRPPSKAPADEDDIDVMPEAALPATSTSTPPPASSAPSSYTSSIPSSSAPSLSPLMSSSSSPPSSTSTYSSSNDSSTSSVSGLPGVLPLEAVDPRSAAAPLDIAVSAAAALLAADIGAFVDPLTGISREQLRHLQGIPATDLLAAVGLPSRFSSYARVITNERLRALKGSIALEARQGMRLGEHFMAALTTYVDSGWATMEVKYDGLADDGSRSVSELRVFLQSSQQREILRLYPHCVDVTAIDATHTVGAAAIQLYSEVAHIPECGGDAIPLSFYITLASADQDAPSRTDGILWWMHKSWGDATVREPPALTLADKCAASAKAAAASAHERMESAAGRAHRAQVIADLEAGALGCTSATRAAARHLLSVLRGESLRGAAAAAANPPAASAHVGASAAVPAPAAAFAHTASTSVSASISLTSTSPAATSTSAPIPQTSTLATTASPLSTVLTPAAVAALAAAAPGAANAAAHAHPSVPAPAPVPSAAPARADDVDSAAAAGLDSIACDFPTLEAIVAMFPGADTTPPPTPACAALYSDIFIPCVTELFGCLLPGLCAVLLDDMAAAEAKREKVRDESFGHFQDAHDDLFAHAYVWSKTGNVGSYLRRYCLLTYALCYFHAKAAMLKRAKQGDCGLVKHDREAAVESLFNIVIRKAVSRTDALELFEVYREKWADRATDVWFNYLIDNWLCEAWCDLLLLSKRDRCARLFIITTNSVETLWRILKRHWLRGKKVADYSRALLRLVGAPDNPNSQLTCLVGSTWLQMKLRLSGNEKRSTKLNQFRLIAGVERLAATVIAGDTVITSPLGPSSGVFVVSSVSPTVRFTQREQGAVSSASTRLDDYVVYSFYGDTARTPARIAEAVTRAKEVGRGRVPKVEAVRRDDVDGLSAVIRSRGKDPFSIVAQHRGLKYLYGPHIEKYVNDGVLMGLIGVNNRRLLKGMLREGPARGYIGSTLTKRAAAESLADVTTVAAAPADALPSLAASSSPQSSVDGGAHLPIVLAPALQIDLELNHEQHAVLEHGWAPLRRGDFGDSTPPIVSMVYAVDVGVPADVTNWLCDEYLVRGVRVSYMDGRDVEWGARLMLQEAQALATGLVAAGRGDELIYFTYIGLEDRGEDSDTQFTRVWDHLMGKSKGAAAGPGSAGLGQLLRFTSKKATGRALTPRSSVVQKGNTAVPQLKLCFMRRVLAFLHRRQSSQAPNYTLSAEALLGAACWGRGGVLATFSPTGEARRYHAKGFDGSASRSEEDMTDLLSSTTSPVARTSGLEVVHDALLARQLHLAQHFLMSGVFVKDTPMSTVAEYAAVSAPVSAPRRLPSLYECIMAVLHMGEVVPRAPFHVVVWADFCGFCQKLLIHHSPCKHLMYCRGKMMEFLAIGLSAEALRVQRMPWWAMDTPMYLNFRERRHLDVLAVVPAAAPAAEVSLQLTSDWVLTTSSSFAALAALHCQLLVATAAEISVEPEALASSVAVIRSSFQSALLQLDSLSISDGERAADVATSTDRISDVSKCLSYGTVLKSAATTARNALGVITHTDVRRTTVSGSAGPLDKSARSREDVLSANRRLVAIPAPMAVLAVQDGAAGDGQQQPLQLGEHLGLQLGAHLQLQLDAWQLDADQDDVMGLQALTNCAFSVTDNGTSASIGIGDLVQGRLRPSPPRVGTKYAAEQRLIARGSPGRSRRPRLGDDTTAGDDEEEENAVGGDFRGGHQSDLLLPTTVGFLTTGIPISRRHNRAHPTSRPARPAPNSVAAGAAMASRSGSLRSDARLGSGGGVLAESGDTPMHSSAIVDISRSSSDFAKREAGGGKAQQRIANILLGVVGGGSNSSFVGPVRESALSVSVADATRMRDVPCRTGNIESICDGRMHFRPGSGPLSPAALECNVCGRAVNV